MGAQAQGQTDSLCCAKTQAIGTLVTMGAPMSTTKPVANPEDAFLSPGDGVDISFWIISIALGLAGWAYIINEIFNGESGGNANGCSAAVATAFNNMRQIVTVGWSIYPLGYFFGYLLNSVDETFLNVIYNIADFVNKIAFVLSCWSCASDSEG